MLADVIKSVMSSVLFSVLSSTSLSWMWANGEPGFWYDPSDFSTLYQDSAGTTPVTASGQSVGLIRDKSGRGNHATAAGTKRPTLGRHPASGIRNLLTYTEDFSNAAWTKSNATMIAAAVSAPSILSTVYKVEATTSAATTFGRSIAAGSTSATASIYVKKGSGALDVNKFGIRNSTTSTNLLQFTINYDTGALSYTTGSTGAFAESVGDGWWRVSFVVSSGFSATDTLTIWFGFWGSSETAAEFAYMSGAQLETGSTATPYQKVVSAFDVTEVPYRDLWYLGFDGVDDALVTSTITPGTDKVQVFAGVRKLSDATVGIIYESSVSASLNAGTIQLYNALDLTIQGRARGSNDVSVITPALSAAPLSFVATLQGDIAGDTSSIRINGVSRASSTADQGTGNYLAYPLYIGARGGTSLFFNGRLYGLIGRFGPNLSAGQIANTENWLNAKTGAY